MNCPQSVFSANWRADSMLSSATTTVVSLAHSFLPHYIIAVALPSRSHDFNVSIRTGLMMKGFLFSMAPSGPKAWTRPALAREHGDDVYACWAAAMCHRDRRLSIGDKYRELSAHGGRCCSSLSCLCLGAFLCRAMWCAFPRSSKMSQQTEHSYV